MNETIMRHFRKVGSGFWVDLPGGKEGGVRAFQLLYRSAFPSISSDDLKRRFIHGHVRLIDASFIEMFLLCIHKWL